jgi:hypothetical protein
MRPPRCGLVAKKNDAVYKTASFLECEFYRLNIPAR